MTGMRWRNARGLTRTACLQALVALAAFLPAAGGDALAGARCPAHADDTAAAAGAVNGGTGTAADHAHAGGSHPDGGALPPPHGDHDGCVCIGTCHASATAALGSAADAASPHDAEPAGLLASRAGEPRRTRPDRLLPFALPHPAPTR